MKNKATILVIIILIVAIIAGAFMAIRNLGSDGTNTDGSTGSPAESTEPGGTESGTDGTESNPGGTTGNDATKDPTEDNSTISGTETTEPGTETTEPDTGTTEPDTETTVPGIEPSKPNDDTSDETKACAHSWSNWTTKAATCTSNGTKTRTCANCKQVETQTIPATGHTYGSWSTTKSATCDTNGVKTRKCSKCGNEETQTIAATGHNWDEGKVTVTPTSCSDMGIKTYTCQTCGKTKTEQIQGDHTFGSWQWEEYTFQHSSGGTYTSHRKYRTCTKCGYKETDGTADHICQKGSDNHVVTTVKEGTCTTKATMRSTCKICGWYVEYEGSKGKCNWVDKEVHLSDYGPYTNELDATVSECTSCGDRSVVYHLGEGWSDYNRYRVSLSANSGNAYMAQPQVDNFDAYNHPTWQMVRRDFVYDSDGYVKQFTLYWWYNGSRYSQVIKCGEGEMEAWFAEYGLSATSANSHYQIRVYGTEVRPYKISYTG